jgi:hypothetical protein
MSAYARLALGTVLAITAACSDDATPATGGGDAGGGDENGAGPPAGGGAGAGASGAGGQGGAPPPPAACPRGPNAPSAIGVWEEISPPEFKNPSNMESASLVVNPVDLSVYAAAGNKTNGGDGGTGVFKSTDCGATWAKVSTGENGAKLETGVIWSMRIDFDEPERMYLASGYGNDPTIYRSLNGGVDWQPLAPDPEEVVNDFVQAIGMNPNDSKHVAITFHDNCAAPYTPMCLSQTKDGGDTWTLFNGPSALPGWAEGASISVLGDDSYLLAADTGGWFTDDAGESWTKVIEGVHYGVYGGGVHFGSDGAAYLGMANQGVFRSVASGGAALGAEWSLIPGSPQAALVIDDGTRIYASYLHDLGGQPFWSAPLGDQTTWTNMPSATIGRGSGMWGYAPTHHLIYSANLGAGVWRLATE